MDGSGRGLLRGTVQTFAWRDLGRSRETSVRLVDSNRVPSEYNSERLPLEKLHGYTSQTIVPSHSRLCEKPTYTKTYRRYILDIKSVIK
jgi:hypothetical protein